MKIGFLKWPFQGISITDSWCVHNFNILKTDQKVSQSATEIIRGARELQIYGYGIQKIKQL